MNPLDRFSPSSLGSGPLSQFRALSEHPSQPPYGGSRLPHVQSFPQEIQRNSHLQSNHHQSPHNQMPQGGANGPVNVEEWRANFKALLPNVNVRFVGKFGMLGIARLVNVSLSIVQAKP